MPKPITLAGLIRWAYRHPHRWSEWSPVLMKIARMAVPPTLIGVPFAEASFAGKRFTTQRKVEFTFRRGKAYKRRIRGAPKGEWVLPARGKKVEGTLTLRRPLVMDWGPAAGTWAGILNQLMGTRMGGPRLTQKLQRLRFDGLVLVRRGKPVQVIVLRLPEGDPQAAAKFAFYFGEGPELSFRVEPESLEGYDPMDVAESILGRETTGREIAHLVGAGGLPGDSYNVSFQVIAPDKMIVRVSGPHIKVMSRTIQLLPDDSFEVHNDYVHLEMEAPKGMGVKLLYSQVLAVQAVGGPRVSCGATREDPDYTAEDIELEREAARSEVEEAEATVADLEYQIEMAEDEEELEDLEYELEDARDELAEAKLALAEWEVRKPDPGLIGYYVWPRLGYNSTLMAAMNGPSPAIYVNSPFYGQPWEVLIPRMIGMGLFPERITEETPIDQITIRDLMCTQEGRDWWKELGVSFEA